MLPQPPAGEQDLERLRRRDEHVRRMAGDRGPLLRGRVPMPNRDPITGAPGAHPVGVGAGAASAGAAGAALGAAVGGPIGAVVGAAVGAVAGGLGGKAAAEAVNPTIEDVGATSAASDAPDRSATGAGEPE